ncbi:MAG: hypothetical protein M5U16_16310 [Hyphomicrobium sp.]|nr:hypothetical protein [Hyphomicrobium sp.]
MSKKVYRPGNEVPRSGQVEIVGPRGGLTGEERTVVKGERMPPTPGAGQGFVYSDLTKNKSGRG